jgi:uncharacterized protein
VSDADAVAPTVTEVNRGFWEACSSGHLAVQRCETCGRMRYPISPICPDCLSGSFVWTPVSGLGELVSFVVFHQVYSEAWRERAPYNVALVRLDEGPQLVSNVIGIDNSDLRVGMPLVVAFEPLLGSDIALPRFEPAP